jgi:endoglucanase
MEKTMSVHKFLFAFILTFLLLTIVLPLDGFSQLPCARGRVKVVRNGNLNWATGQYDPNGPGRTVVSDQGTILRGYNAWAFGPGGPTNWTYNRQSWKIAKKYGMNVVRFATNHYNVGIEWNEYIRWMDQVVNWAQEENIYVMIDYHLGIPSRYNMDRARFFWKNVAPRYKDRTHVFYELMNEPVAWTPSKYTDQIMADFNELYQLVRGLAPNTHISILCYPMIPVNESALAIQLVGKLKGIDWTNTSVGFHSYHVITARQFNDLKMKYPVINTEFSDPASPLNRPLDGMRQHEQAMERLKISWMAWMNNDEPDAEARFMIPMINDAKAKGYIWKPDDYTKCPGPIPTTSSMKVPFRIESGSSTQLTDSASNIWLADQHVNGGNILDRGPIAIAGTLNPRIYQTERYGLSGYSFPVANGKYTVKLHFAETFSGINAPAQRVFDVNVEGVAIKDLDVYKEAPGRDMALVKSVNVSVTDGTLNISFTQKVQLPMINGIEVLAEEAPPTPTPTPKPTPTPSPTPILIATPTPTASPVPTTSNCPRGRVKVVRNGNLNWATGQYDPNGPGRTVVSDQGTLLRAYNAWFYFDGGSSRARWTKDRNSWRVARQNGLNAVRLAVNHYNLGITWDQFVVHMDNFVNWAQEERIYLLITYTPNQPGTYNFARAKFFWERIAPRYKDRTHVLYEINNEPVAWTPAKYTDQTIKDLSELYTLVRRLAPQTHISILTIPMLPKDQLGTAINVINKHVAVDWNNTSVAFHSYHVTSAWQMNELKKSYPVINTEFCDPSSSLNKSLDGMLWHEQAMERLRISWMNWTINSLESRPRTTLVSMLNDAKAKGYIWKPDDYTKCPGPIPAPTPKPTPTPGPSNLTTLRIDSGSSAAYVDAAQRRWEADRNFIGGNILDRNTLQIANTNVGRIYQTERYGLSGYAIPVTNGTHQVTLHFAETFEGITAARQRIFDVSLEGVVVIKDLDIFAMAGGRNIALVRSFPVVVKDGILNIGFTKKVQFPTINAIEVVSPVGPIATPTPTPVTSILNKNR